MRLCVFLVLCGTVVSCVVCCAAVPYCIVLFVLLSRSPAALPLSWGRVLCPVVLCRVLLCLWCSVGAVAWCFSVLGWSVLSLVPCAVVCSRVLCCSLCRSVVRLWCPVMGCVVYRRPLLPPAVSCGAVLPCAAVRLGSAVLFCFLLVVFFRFTSQNHCLFCLPLKSVLKYKNFECFSLKKWTPPKAGTRAVSKTIDTFPNHVLPHGLDAVVAVGVPVLQAFDCVSPGPTCLH